MQAVTLKDSKKSFPQIVERVLTDAEAHILVTPSGQQVVLMPLDEYESWKETLYLLSNPANAARLRQSMQQAEEGQIVQSDLVDA